MIFIFLNDPDINNTNLRIINHKGTQTCLGRQGTAQSYTKGNPVTVRFT